MTKLSVVIPAYNEKATIEMLLARVAEAPLPPGVTLEMVVVDDGSRDGTRELLRELVEKRRRPSSTSSTRRTRAKARRCAPASRKATGDVLLVQDADLEYSPNDYPVLLQPILDGQADVVFGSRFLGGPHRVLFFWHSVGNRFLTMLSNMFTDLNLSDMETCYKVFKAEVLHGMVLQLEPLRDRAGADRAGGQDPGADLRGADLLPRPHLCRRQEDRLARRLLGDLVDPPLQPLS